MLDTKLLNSFIELANQLFEIEHKLAKISGTERLNRNLRRMKQALENAGIRTHDPLGEEWSETRTDCEASISGASVDNLKIVEVIKPILRWEENGVQQIIQRGVVIVGEKQE
ncbi:MAG: hypothetical protein MRZ79_11240 [Bacteroidia bacterium]|nr:hypothetical protein [Bacteroidia bacterium]